jgi:hypothetical protein
MGRAKKVASTRRGHGGQIEEGELGEHAPGAEDRVVTMADQASR